MAKPTRAALGAPSLLIAMPAVRRDLTVLDTAARLAQITGASLRALLIEDPVLAQAAGLPLTREYDRRSGGERAIDQPRVTRHLRAHRRTAREHLQKVADALQLSSSLQVAHGEFMREALKAALEVDFALIDPRNAGRVGPLSDAERRWLLGNRGSLAGHARRAPHKRVMWAVCSDEIGNDRALAVARAIAASERTTLQVLRFRDSPSSRMQAGTSRQETAGPGRGERTEQTLQSILVQVSNQASGLLVLPLRVLRDDSAGPDRRTLANLPCPLLLVG